VASTSLPPIIFIDANIYLKFFEARRDHLRTMLAALKEAEPFVFVTRQIVQEVRRNQHQVFARQVEQLLANIPSKLSLPSFHGDANSKARKQWNKRIATNEAKLKAIGTKYRGDAVKMGMKIRQSSDPVSLALEGIFSTAIEASTAELEQARLRRERGNPPGKRGDPLGDQLSWEQLLGKVKTGQSVWIVAEDGDYWDEFCNETALKTLLHHELVDRLGKSASVHCFKGIDVALRHFSEYGVGLKQLPTPKVQGQIAEETKATPSVADQVRGYDLTNAAVLQALGYNPATLSNPQFYHGATINPHLYHGATINPYALVGVGCPVCGKSVMSHFFEGDGLVGTLPRLVYTCSSGHKWSPP